MSLSGAFDHLGQSFWKSGFHTPQIYDDISHNLFGSTGCDCHSGCGTCIPELFSSNDSLNFNVGATSPSHNMKAESLTNTNSAATPNLDSNPFSSKTNISSQLIPTKSPFIKEPKTDSSPNTELCAPLTGEFKELGGFFASPVFEEAESIQKARVYPTQQKGNLIDCPNAGIFNFPDIDW
jgi:hypothetical protein